MNYIQHLLSIRATLQSLCEQIDDLIAYCNSDEFANEHNLPAEKPEPHSSSVYSLCMDPSFFKGKKIEAVIFPDGVKIETPTWKALVEVILKRCNNDEEKHAALLGLRKRVQGRSRKLINNSDAGMRSPIKIDRGLYIESHYDTESLLRIMTTRILDAVNYDYSGIQIAIRK